jgi:hypothetical protein
MVAGCVNQRIRLDGLGLESSGNCFGPILKCPISVRLFQASGFASQPGQFG